MTETGTRVSEYFELGRTQPALDFIDVDTEGDTRAFVDPRAIKKLPGDWAEGCVGLLQNFFRRLLRAVRQGDRATGLELLRGLREPNETHLGLSRSKARGSGLGNRLAEQVWAELQKSEAAKTGLLRDLEDTALVIEGIDIDRVSDITTNIIRLPLIDYTQQVAEQNGIPLHQVGSGHVWDPTSGAWEEEHFTELPVTPTGRLLLVPKAIVRTRLDFDPGEYYRHYVLELLRDRELAAGTALVHTLKSGDKRVYKKDVEKKHRRRRSTEKKLSERVTLDEPTLLAQYRADKGRRSQRQNMLDHLDLSLVTGGKPPDWKELLDGVLSLSTGGRTATAYHRAVEGLLTALLYPGLTNPKIESELHQGRKRVDIRYTNSGAGGFFTWLRENYPPQPYLFVECKNYRADLANDALDQISGRFSRQRGTFGLLVCRGFADKAAFIERCRDTASDDRGYVIVLDDADLTALTELRRMDKSPETFQFFEERLAELVT